MFGKQQQQQYQSPLRFGGKYATYVALVTAVVYTIFSFGSRSKFVPNSTSESFTTKKPTTLSFWIPKTPNVSLEKTLKDKIPGTDGSPLNDCRVTSQFKVTLDSREPNRKWILQSMDNLGKPKNMGGDEFYITFKDKGDLSDRIHPSAVGIAVDQQDGTYEIEFVAPPLAPAFQYNNQHDPEGENGGNLTIHLQYSCGIGFLAPPVKDEWPDGGALRTSFTVGTNVSPAVRPFQPPSIAAGILSKYQQVLVFGDSAMKQFVKNGSQSFQENIVFRVKRRKPWTTALIDEHLKVLHMQLGRDLDATNTQVTPVPSKALLLGSSIWDVLATRQEQSPARRHLQKSGRDEEAMFEDHLKACRHFITTIRQEYPNVQVLWKSPTAMHIHVVDPENPVNHATKGVGDRNSTVSLLRRVRYMSSSRMFHLHQLQRQLMQELEVPVLDVYEATYLSASWTLSGDGRHYSPELHKHMLDWFY